MSEPNWDAIVEDVAVRVQMLRAVWNEPGPMQMNIRRDLVIPAITKLGEFCACVQVEEEQESPD